MPTPTDLVTDLPADFEVFGQAVDTSLADLKGGSTGQVLSKNSNTDMDFVWVTSDDANAIQNTIVDAKGDLIAASAADTPARLAVGANGTVLTADSAEATGMKWAAAAGGSGLTLISTQTAADVATLTFDNVFSSTYNNYFLVYNGVRSTSAATTADLYFQFRYAGPTTQTATYAYGLYGVNTASAAIAVGAVAQSQMILGRNLGNPTTRLQGQMFIEGVGEGSTGFPFANGQTTENWGEEFLSYGMVQYTARTYTGFIISTSSGNINGTFALYGLAKS